jgi:GT2 family glycosyltransferase
LNQRVGIVVPTLGNRTDYLEQCLRSIRAAGDVHILLVAPASFNSSALKSSGLIDSAVVDPNRGLPAAINQGVKELPSNVEYVNWLGDDDVLTEGSLGSTFKFLENDSEAVMVFGSCDYIDGDGQTVWVNKSGQWAVPLLRIGPDLIPQPGALFRRSAFDKVGGLRTDLGWAFDFDLFIRLSKAGKLRFLGQTLAQFRWHPESLSVEHRKKSVAEASRVRVSHLPEFLKPISLLWEYPVRQATLVAGKRVTAKAKSKAETN